MKHSQFKEFIRDFGDAIGGIMIGYAIGKDIIGYGVVGVILVLSSIYIRFYSKKEKV